MISFDFTPEQEQFRQTLDTFARKVLLPGYVERAAGTEYPMELQRELGKLGVLGIGLPEEFGGSGADDPVMLGLACETLGYGDVNVAAAPVQIGLVGAQLNYATREVQEEYFPPIISGEITMAIGLTEPGGGSDASGLRTVARPVDGGWRLSGEKTAITWACNAQAAMVYARAPGSIRSKGISCFMVPLRQEGVTVTAAPGMGCLPLGWGAIHFDDVFVPASHLVGEEGRGFHAAMHHFDFSRPALGLMCLGAAQVSLDETAAYVLERETFGQKLASYQGISFQLAEHATYMEAARALCYRALWARAAGREHTALASMSKWWPPVVAKNAIESALTMHGNLGYSAQFPFQQRLRDVIGYLVGDGTAEIQKRVIATSILGPIAAGR